MKGPILTSDRITEKRCYTARDHQNNPIAFRLQKIESEDEEPVLKEPSVAISGQICRGTLHPDAGSGGYEIVVSGENPTGTEGIPHEEVVGRFPAFPDEKPWNDGLKEGECDFIILAATEQLLKAGDRPTYSGIGIILAAPSTLKRRYKAKLAHLEMQMIELEREANDDPSLDNNWERKEKADAIDFAKRFVDRLAEEEEKIDEARPRYRRIGAVHFQQISEEVWRRISSAPMTNFWLD